MDINQIINFISERRKELGLSQNDIANKLGYSSQLIFNWEKNKSLPDLSIISNLCNILNLTIDELFNCQIKSNNKKEKLQNFNIDEFVNEVATDALKKLGSSQCESGNYPVVLNQHSFSQLLAAYLSNIDAEEVQKKSSLLIGKLHKPVASKKLTVIENPLEKNIFFRYFDDEGVATNRKFIIKNGELLTYIYTLETAFKDGAEPTGNGYRGGGKAHASLNNVIVKPGKKSFDEMISTIKNGVYITEFQGLHSGLNAQSGNFSLQSCGFMIENGKVTKPLSLITTAGNLVELFNDIKCVANDSKFIIGTATNTPSVFIKKLSISGK